ncbi:hypothetical protein [Nocardia vinacea]|uniref:hypothetical protein n=1 Tax=Nocardia vinacea TaxID=96468 RepID=UPI0006876CEF|nr:hypothetical protein [Nocardia vinacea]
MLRFRREMVLRLMEAAEIAGNPALRSLPHEGERLLDAVAGRSSLPRDRLRAWMLLGAVVVGATTVPDMPHSQLRGELFGGGRLLDSGCAANEPDEP